MKLLPLLLSLVCLCAAAPPAWFVGAELLVLPGWVLFCSLLHADGLRRPRLWVYLLGVAHMLYFSFSVHRVLLPAWLAIGVVGGLYYLLCFAWARALMRWLPGGVAFGIALAGVHFARAHCPEIHYPHGQPIHSLHAWPGLLQGPLRLGSELLGNLLLGCLAGALVDLYQAWKVARPRLRPAGLQLGLVLAGWAACSFLAPAPAPATSTVKVALVEPGISRSDWPRLRQMGLLRFLREVMVPATEALAGPAVADPPALLLWPESFSLHFLYPSPSGTPRLSRALLERDELPKLHPRTRLLSGTGYELASDAKRVAALLIDHRWRYVGHQEKRRLVPGGERQPFLTYLPASWLAWLRGAFERAMGMPLPDYQPGQVTPLLQTADGQAFAALICYDNAFPEVCLAAAAQGAGFFVVLSNEAWYERGAELDQMVAMSVCRCLETGLAMVRCTVDGPSLLLGADGRVRASLPWTAPQASGLRNLVVDVPSRTGGDGALAPLRTPLAWVVLLSGLALFLPRRRNGGRLGQEQDLRPGDPAS